MTLSHLQENVQMAFATLRARKLRTGLTLLGIVIGVASVIAVAAIIDGLQQTVQDRVEILGSRAFYVMRLPLGANPSRVPARLRGRRYLEYGYSQQLREHCPSLAAVSAGATRGAVQGYRNEIRYGADVVERFSVRGAEPAYADAIPLFVPSAGRFINQEDMDKRRNVVVLGAGLVEALFPVVDPVGRQVRLNGQIYEVIGALEGAGSLLGGASVDNFVLIPSTTFRKAYPEIREVVLTVAVRAEVPVEQGRQELVDAMRRIRQLRAKAPNDFDLASSDYISAWWKQVSGALVVLATLLSSIGLLVGGLGVMNIMLISVTERTAEIGVRKAIGARRNEIRLQFLLEAVILTVVGGLLGVVLGVLIAFVVSAIYPSVQATLSYQWAALGVAMSAGVGLVFGFLPANRAAGLDPIVCLRYE